jgi:hypothetical protein
MASTAKPGDRDPGRTDDEVNRAAQGNEPADEAVIAAGADEAVDQSRAFPSGGGDGGTEPGGTAPGGTAPGGTAGAATGGQG